MTKDFVWCRDCVFYKQDPDPTDPGWPMMCELTGMDMVRPDCYCAWGVRREPTCTMRADSDYVSEELYPCNALRCSNCGELVWDVNPLNYCPNCGHRVLEAV